MAKGNSNETKRRVRIRRGTALRTAQTHATELLRISTREDLQRMCSADLTEDLNALQEIIRGTTIRADGTLAPIRNAASRVKAIATKWAYGFGIPRQQIDLKGEVTLLQLLMASIDVRGPKAQG